MLQWSWLRLCSTAVPSLVVTLCVRVLTLSATEGPFLLSDTHGPMAPVIFSSGEHWMDGRDNGGRVREGGAMEGGAMVGGAMKGG